MAVSEVLRTAGDLGNALRVQRSLKPRPPETHDSIGLKVQETAARLPEHTKIVFEGRTVTWGEFNALSNRYANALRDLGVKRGEAVSVIMENRIEFLAALVAINKLGAIAALINNNLSGRPLTHCVQVTESRKCIFGAEVKAAVRDVRADLSLANGADYLFVADGDGQAPDWARDFATLASNAPADNPAETAEVRLGDPALYLFTSGTTGLPKAAVVSHRRFLTSAAASWKAGLKSSEDDRLYLCLPLYHGTGLMVGWGSTLWSGSSMFIRRKFSASRFLDEVREHRTNCLVYIGELCRYLVNQPERPDDADNPLERMIGNGLRPDIWETFKSRYDVDRITEFYGASEGNVAFVNLLNKNRTIGMTSQKIALVRYDVDSDEILRDDDGHCIAVETGEPGLLLAEIDDDHAFEGYTNREATEKKILRNAFAEGDAWFNSGDLIRRVDVGFSFGIPHYQFVDRVGDTFRWKSENVSTNEVGEIVNGHPQVQMCNVYGVEVPAADGRAGMAAVLLKDGVDLELASFSAFVREQLPAYAQPVFLRVQRDADITGTFKLVKGDLRKQGYDLDLVADDPIYVMKPKSEAYEPLTAEYLATIRAGQAGF